MRVTCFVSETDGLKELPTVQDLFLRKADSDRPDDGVDAEPMACTHVSSSEELEPGEIPDDEEPIA